MEETARGRVEAAGGQGGDESPACCSIRSFGSSAGKGSTFSDIVRRAGGINLGDEALDGPFGEISLEKIVELNPDVIITDEYRARGQRGVAARTLATIPPWPT